MVAARKDLPKINTFWVGPPRAAEASGAPGSDVRDVIEMAKRVDPGNEINFFCLDEYKQHYKELFEKLGVNVKVVSMDAYMEEKKKHGDPEMREYANKMIEVRKVLLEKPRNRIVERVSFKDVFSLFVLANEGGYIMDSTVRLQEGPGKVTFPHHDEFKALHTKGPFKGDKNVETWMMYGPRNALNVPRKMLHHYLSRWDDMQRIIQGNEKSVPHIMKYHDQSASLIVLSIQEGLTAIKDPNRRYDDNWYINVEDVQAAGVKAAPGVKAIATFRSNDALPIIKSYGNAHLPYIECREIITARIQELGKSVSVDEKNARSDVIQILQAQLAKYSECKSNKEADRLNIHLDKCIKVLNQLDEYAARFQGNGEMKMRFEKRIDEAYNLLGKVAASSNGIVDGKHIDPEEILKSFQDASSKKGLAVQAGGTANIYSNLAAASARPSPAAAATGVRVATANLEAAREAGARETKSKGGFLNTLRDIKNSLPIVGNSKEEKAKQEADRVATEQTTKATEKGKARDASAASTSKEHEQQPVVASSSGMRHGGSGNG